MNPYLYFGLIILSAIIIVYFLSYLYNNGELPAAPFDEYMTRMKTSASTTYDNYFTSAADMYEKTVGYVNDEAAKMALDKSLQKERMYTRNEQLGRLSDKTTADAAATSFMIADLYRFNVAPNDNDPTVADAAAAAQYASAMRRVAANPLGAVTTLDPHMPPAEFMIDRAEDFYEDYVARQTLDRDPNVLNILNIPNLLQLRNDVRQARVAAAGTTPVPGALPVRTRTTRRKKNQTEKERMRDTYFADRDIRNDPQNVHETQVNKDMARIYRSIIQRNAAEDDIIGGQNDNAQTARNIAAIRDYARTYKFEDSKQRERAMKTIETMAAGNWISGLNSRENDILSNVWKRTSSAENEGNRANMRAALMSGLADCVETGYNGQDYQVCASGRTGRVLGSMTLLDANETISEPIKTVEVLRNEAFAKSFKIIQDALKETDEETVRGYNGALENPAPDVATKVEAFEHALRDRIEKSLRAEYSDKTDEKVLNNLINDAQAGV